MNVFNLQAVTSFLLSFNAADKNFSTLMANCAIANEFGVTKITASKWRERAIDSGIILPVIGGTGYYLVVKEACKARDIRASNKRQALSGSNVHSFQMAKFKRSTLSGEQNA